MRRSIVILLVLGTAAGAWGATVTYTWTGAGSDSNWGDGANWTQNPDIGHPVPGIWGYSPYSTVNIDPGIVTVSGVGVAGANTLNIGSTSQINLIGGDLIVTTVLNNGGQINISAGRFDVGGNSGDAPWNNPNAQITASGGGTINLTGGQLLITSPLTLAAQNIVGNGTGLITCNGLAGLCLTLLPGNSIQADGGGLAVAGATINNTSGLLQAVNGGTLQLGGGHYSYGPTYISGGTIQAQNGSTVLLGYANSSIGDSAGKVTGSTLNTFGSGVIQASNDMVLDSITNNGTLQIVNTGVPNNEAVLANTIDNAGTITLAGGNIQISGSATLTGAGTVNMGGQRISSGTLTNVDNVIQGAGSFSNITVNNQIAGVIDSNTSGQTLSITGSTINNSGTLEASNGGTLQLGGGHNSGGPTYVNGGTIQALGGSTVLLGYTNPGDYDSAGTITGSTFNTTGSGVIKASEYTVLNGITNHGTLDIVAIQGVGGSVVTLENTINNTGTITIAGGSIQLSGPVSLTGNGTVNLGGSSISGDTLTSANTIQGSGSVQTLTNLGTVHTAAGDSMTIGNLTNLSGGTLTGGIYDVAGTLAIQGMIVNNAATIILDGTSSFIEDPGIDALASTFADNQAGGTFEILNGRNFTTAGAFSNQGVIDVGAGSTLTISDDFTNTGSLDINGTLIAESVGIGAGQSLSGSGTIDGNVTVYGSTDPGNSPGILTVDGDYTQESGSFLNIQLGGTGLGQFDQLNVNGDLSLSGTLDVSLWNGFVPGNGNTFHILNWTGTRTGSFGAIDYPTLSSGYYFESLWGANSLTLEVGYSGGGGSATPEPATCFLIGAGLLVGIYRRRAKRPIG